MNPYDARQAAEVWSRVTRATADAQSDSIITLDDMIRDELSDRDAYFALARRVRPIEAQTLRAIAREEATHARKLSTVWFVRSGAKPSHSAQSPSASRSVTDVLREHIQKEQAGAEQYARAAELDPACRELFTQLALDERRHAKLLMAMLEARM